MHSPKDKVIESIVRAGYEYDDLSRRCQCPAHEGEGFNLAVNENEKGDVLLTCHSHGCASHQICQAVGIAESDLFAPEEYTAQKKQEAPKRKVYDTVDDAHTIVVAVSGMREVASWDYQNADGVTVGRVIRLDDGHGGKQFRQISLTDDGWSAIGMPGKRPMYNLPAVIEADTVVLCEGEKACDVAIAQGYVATTSTQGSKSAKRTDWSPLAGKTVYILPDNDESGHEYARQVTQLIPASCSWRMYDLASAYEVPRGGDIADIDDLNLDQYFKSAEYSSYEAPERAKTLRFSGQTVNEMWAAAEEEVDWMVDGVFAMGQPTIMGAEQKCCKTTLLSDLVVALATATPWLQHFNVKQPRRTLFITGESSDRGAMKRIRRAVESRHIAPASINGMLRIETFDFPTVSLDSDLKDLALVIEKYKSEVVVVDPLYMALANVNTANVCEVGPVLKAFARNVYPANIILAHHIKKSASYDEVPDLKDLSQAGIAEFAGNFWMMGRLQPYKGDGLHHLSISMGGRDEQFGRYHLLANEFDWEFEFEEMDEYEQRMSEQKQIRKEQKKNEDRQKKEEEKKQAAENKKKLILEYAEASETPFLLNAVDSSRRCRPLLEEMVSDGELVALDGYTDDQGTRHKGRYYARAD